MSLPNPPSETHTDDDSNEYNRTTDDNLIIQEDGPKPMKDLKPVQKHPNSADYFQEQNKLYEGEEPSNPCSRVDIHNRACPKLIDEIRNRKSIAKVTVRSNKDLTTDEAMRISKTKKYFDPKCKKCIKERKAEEKRKEREKRAAEKKKNRGKVVKKPKSRKRYVKLRLEDFQKISRGCQYVAPKFTKSNGSIRHFDKLSNRKRAGNRPCCSRQMKGFVYLAGSKKSVVSESFSDAYPDTSKESLASYHSYPSQDHEEMDQEDQYYQ